MVGWRICKKRHAASALSGVGAEKHGGRWNHRGDRMVYMSTSLSLAALEFFVHLQPDNIPDDLVSVSIVIPADVSAEIISADQLPNNWRDFPAPASLQEIGSKWLRESRSLLLIVPSAINPIEQNVMLNPAHPGAIAVKETKSQPFQFDPRMWKYTPRRK
jgi:RES domain-containing protein